MALRTAGVLLLFLAGSLAGCIRVEVGGPQAVDTQVGSPDDGLTTLSLAIVDSAGDRPLPGAEVRLSIPGVGSVRKTTGSDGEAAFTVAPAASCTVQVTRSGYQPRTDPLQCGKDQAYRIPLRAAKGGAASGTGSIGPRPTSTGGPPVSGNGTDGGAGNGTGEGNGTAPRPFEPEEPAGDGDCAGLAPRHTGADPVGVALPAGAWPVLQIDMAAVADPTFAAANPDTWRDLLRDLVADLSAIYEEQLGVRVNLTVLDRLPDGSLVVEPAPPTTDPLGGQDNMRAVARGFMQANHAADPYDVVAVILGANYSGAVAGKVECVGGAADREYAYLWAEYDEPRNEGGGVGTGVDFPLKVLAHETAHLLDAHHHYSNCGEAVLAYRPDDLMGMCDIMINDIGLASLHFGALNRHVIRSFIEESGIAEPVG